jgi:hypothetical protein
MAVARAAAQLAGANIHVKQNGRMVSRSTGAAGTPASREHGDVGRDRLRLASVRRSESTDDTYLSTDGTYLSTRVTGIAANLLFRRFLQAGARRGHETQRG